MLRLRSGPLAMTLPEVNVNLSLVNKPVRAFRRTDGSNGLICSLIHVNRDDTVSPASCRQARVSPAQQQQLEYATADE